jgi:hypothetical protein
MKKEKLYPITFNGKVMTKRQCDSTFTGYYTCKEALAGDGSVYVANGMRVFPDGNWTE